MTDRMWAVLDILHKSASAGWPFVDLPGIHASTIHAMVRNDWIIASHGLDGIRYSITGRGRKAWRIYQTPTESRRHDGICPRCEKHPKHIYGGGSSAGYCVTCDRSRRRRQTRMVNGLQKSMGSNLCPRCGRRPRHIWGSGRIASYCLPCRRKRAIPARRQRLKNRLAEIAEGQVPKCCKCGDDVHYTEKSVYDYCKMHQREYMNAYNRKRRMKEENHEGNHIAE